MTLSAIWEMILNNFLGFLLIMCRVSGIFSFNPIFNRSNFPIRLRAGTTIALAVLFAASMGRIQYEPTGIFMLLFDMLKELGLGLILGFMVNLVLTVTISAGEIIDYQTGLSMARTMVPDSASSQFFICHADAKYLDGQYAAFGKVIEGMDVVDAIAETKTDANDRPKTEQKMKTVRVIE